MRMVRTWLMVLVPLVFGLLGCNQEVAPPPPPPPPVVPPPVTPPPITPPPADTTPPGLSQALPASDALSVEPDAAIRAVFSEALAAGSLNGNATLKRSADNQPVSSQITLNADTLEIAHPALTLRTQYTVTLGAGLTDLAGNAFAGTSWNFRTRDGLWRDPLSIHDGTGQGAPVLAVNAAGRGIAVWPEFPGSDESQLWANWYDPKSGWRGAELLVNLGQRYLYSPRVTLDAAGNALVIWGQSTELKVTARQDLVASGSSGNGLWTKPQAIETEDVYNAVSPDLAGDSSGRAVAVWAQGDGKLANIWANTYAPGSGWGSPTLLETNNKGTASNPRVAVDERGDTHVVWVQTEGTFGINDSIWGTLRDPGGTWDTAFPLELEKPEANNPRLAVNANGDAVVLWNQTEMSGTTGQFHVWTNRYTPAGKWGGAKAVPTPGATASYNGSIALDAKGNAVAVWLQQTGSAPLEVWANRDLFGSGWEAPQQLSKAGQLRVGEAQVAAELEGNAMALWTESNGGLYASRYVFGAWADGGTIQTSSGNAQFAFDAQGRGLCVMTRVGPTLWAKEFR